MGLKCVGTLERIFISIISLLRILYLMVYRISDHKLEFSTIDNRRWTMVKDLVLPSSMVNRPSSVFLIMREMGVVSSH